VQTKESWCEIGLFQLAELRRDFETLYRTKPRVYRAPGRVNLIGEHTDYNDGFVMPVAIGLDTRVAIAPRRDRKLVLRSANYPDLVEVDLDHIRPGTSHHWSDYVRGVAAVLEKLGYRLHGANLLMRSEIPIGAGLGSSAALEVATAYALLGISGIPMERMKLALACQQAEHEFAGTRCGIMDQFIACHGRSEHALMLDTRNLTFQALPLPRKVSVVISNTMVRHDNALGEYNARRAECETGVHLLAGKKPSTKALRDATLADLERSKTELPEKVYRRCRHVITENERVQAAARALQHGNLAEFGGLMSASHRSLRDDYEVSCRELDVLVELASQVKGVYGARMTGGGFGGSTVSLVRAESASEFQTEIKERYERVIGAKPGIYLCAAAQGAEEILLPREPVAG
jgi:galactokinase